MPNAYNGKSGHTVLLVQNVVVQMVAEGGYYIASDDCNYFTYVYDPRTYGASLEEGDVIDLVGKMYVYFGLDELTSVTWVRRKSPSSLDALALIASKSSWHSRPPAVPSPSP